MLEECLFQVSFYVTNSQVAAFKYIEQELPACDCDWRRTMKRIILISILIVFGSLINFPGPIDILESNACDYTTVCNMKAGNAIGNIEGNKLVLYLEEVQEPIMGPDIELFFSGNNTTDQPREQYSEKKSNTEKKDAQQKPTKVRTKLKSVESILKKAVIEPYNVSEQIKGLQLNGLDKISEAKALLLKNGDVILAVNGKTIRSKREAYSVFIKARKKSIMIVDLLQDGEAKTLLFDFHGAV